MCMCIVFWNIIITFIPFRMLAQSTRTCRFNRLKYHINISAYVRVCVFICLWLCMVWRMFIWHWQSLYNFIFATCYFAIEWNWPIDEFRTEIEVMVQFHISFCLFGLQRLCEWKFLSISIFQGYSILNKMWCKMNFFFFYWNHSRWPTHCCWLHSTDFTRNHIIILFSIIHSSFKTLLVFIRTENHIQMVSCVIFFKEKKNIEMSHKMILFATEPFDVSEQPKVNERKCIKIFSDPYNAYSLYEAQFHCD